MAAVRWFTATLAVLVIHMARCHVCPPGWWDWPSGPSCYKITTAMTTKSWKDARLSCQAYQADLVVINSADEQSWLKTQLRLMSMADPDAVQWWSGATSLNGENQWKWTDGTVVSGQASPWQTGQPDNRKGTEHCVYMGETGLNDEDCGTVMPYVCERSKKVTLKCDIDSGWENYHNYCYKFFTTKRSWREAHDVCDNEGGRLATVLLDSIQRYMVDSVNTKKQNSWIGLRSVPADTGPGWRWTYLNTPLSGSGYWANAESSNIQKGSENSSCVEVVADQGLDSLKAWSNADCSQRKTHICEKPEGVCAEGWIQYQSKCYEINTAIRLSWSQAFDYCTGHGTNGSLVEINSPLEQSFMNKLLGELKESGVRQMWVGFTDDETGDITYGSGAPISRYTNWGKEPSDTPNKPDCGLIYTGDKQGKWYLSTDCLQLKSFICQLPTNVPVQAVTTPKPMMSCESGWVLYMNQCLLFNDTVLDWMEAQQACQGQNGQLVSIRDDPKQAFINGHISSAVMWTGLNDRSKEGSFNWADGTVRTFTNWYPGNPQSHGEMNCVGMVSESGHSGQWKDIACTAKHGFICQKQALMNGVTPAPGSTPTTPAWSARCGPNWEEDINLGFCYSFQDRPLSWLDAGQWCSQNGGQLASITTIQEQYFIAGRARGMSSFAVWIGANDRDDVEGWMWTDGSPFAYLNWKPGEPNNLSSENCVNIVVSSGLWNNYRCDARNGFVCKKSNGIGPPTSVKPTTTVQAGVTMGCPAGWKVFRNKCYLFKRQRGDQPTAVLQCRQLGADLVSIADVNEQNFISSQTKSYGQYWIGLNDREIEWTFRWTDGIPVTFTSWARLEPNNFENKDEDCVTMYAYGKHGWNDQLCHFQANGYICKSPQKPVTTTTAIPGCPPSAYLYEGNCYLLVDARKSFQDSESQCVKLGGHLATITDKYQQAYISSELSGKTGQYWIGLRKNADAYTWTSKQNLTYTFWSKAHTGLEKNKCVAMSTDMPVGVWQDIDCQRSRGFICQVRQGGYTTPVPTTPASTIRPETCPSDWKEHQGYCYKAFYNAMSENRLMWSEAVAKCRSYGGDLVSYQNKSEEDFVYQSVLKFYWRGDFWIGLSSRELLQGYHWSDDSPFGYNNWGPDQPDNRNEMENCVAYNPKTKNWFDVNCFVANNWICKLKKGVVLPTNVVSPTAVSAPSCGGPDSKWKYFRGMCYFVSESDKKTWYEARDWCHQHGAHLASIHTKGENDLLTSMTAKLSYGVYWIGLNSLNLDGFKWSDSTGLTFVNWAQNEPNDGNGGQRCVDFYNFNGAWNDDNCMDKNEFICRKVNGSYSALPTVATTVRPGNCPKGFYGYKSKCFFLGGNTQSSLLNWTAAHDMCRSFGSGYELATISNDQEQAFLTTLLGGWNTSLWIGLNDLSHENQFTWVDNSENFYFNWAKGEPSGRMYGTQEDCVHMYSIDYHAGKWNDENCGLLHGYVCQVYKSPSFPTPAPTPLPSWCKPGYTLYGKNCYKLMPDPVSWFRAKLSCRLDGSVLASITSVYEESVVRVLTQDINQPVWIGLHDAEVSGTYEWIDNWPIFYTNWAQGEPSKEIGEGCVSFMPNGKWNDTLCGQQFLPVCKLSAGKPPPVTSPYPGHCADKSWDKWADMCYYVQTSPRQSWPEAKFTCERKGMQLASIHSRIEADFVYKLVSKKKPRYGNTNVWLGLLKGVTSGFQWADNSYVDFVTWEEGEPSDVDGSDHEDCVELQMATSHWNDLPCTTDRGFVCKTPALGIPTTVTTTPSTAQRTKPVTTTPTTRHAQSTRAPTIMPWVPRKTLPNPDHSQPISNQQHAQGSSNTSAGTIVGICVGVLLALALVAAVLIVLKRRQRFVYKSGHPATSFDNVLYPTSTDGVSIQEDLGPTNNGHVQSSST